MYEEESEAVVEPVVFARLPAGGGDTGLDSHPARTATGVGERRYYRYEVAFSTLNLV